MRWSPGQFEGLRDEPERRRRPRFRCWGSAQVSALPANGAPVPGRVVNVSLGGCYVETGLILRPGTLTELSVTVDGIPFRTLSLVRAVRQNSGFGVEFTRLTRRGQDMLRELIEELARRSFPNIGIAPYQRFTQQELSSQINQFLTEPFRIENGLVVVGAATPADANATEETTATDVPPSPSALALKVPFDIVI